MAFRQIQEPALEPGDRPLQPLTAELEVELQIRDRLVVPRAAGVELLGHVAQSLGEDLLDEAVYVFSPGLVEWGGVVLQFLPEPTQLLRELARLAPTQHARFVQGFRPRDASLEVLLNETPVEGKRAIERLERRVERLLEPASPKSGHGCSAR
jgi:hypothetical protein